MPYTHRFAIAAVVTLMVAGAAPAQESGGASPRDPAGATTTPFRAGSFTFAGGADGSLYVAGPTGQFRLLLPAASVPYTVIAPSPDGRFVAYGLAAPGTAGRTYDVHVRDVATGQDLPDVLHDASITFKPWTHDSRGFFYARMDAAAGRERVVYHRLREPQSRDPVVFSELSHPEYRYAVEVSDDGQYAVFTISHAEDAKTALFFLDLQDPGKPKLDSPIVRLVDSFGSRYTYIDDAGTYFLLQTDRGAPRGQIVLADVDVTRESRWPTIVPQQADTLVLARTAGDQYLIAVYRTARGDRIQVFGPPDPRAMRDEMRRKLDSLETVRRRAKETGAAPPISEPMLGRPAIRLQQRETLSLPAGTRVLDMRSVANQDALFYTLRLPGGAMHSYRYDVVKRVISVVEPRATPQSPPAAARTHTR